MRTACIEVGAEQKEFKELHAQVLKQTCMVPLTRTCFSEVRAVKESLQLSSHTCREGFRWHGTRR